MLVIFISFLGIEAKRTSTSLVLIQTKYTLDLLTRTHMQDSKPCPTPLASGSKLSAYDGAPLYGKQKQDGMQSIKRNSRAQVHLRPATAARP
jgi:hypothetical protein